MRRQLVVGKAFTRGRRATAQMVLRPVVVAALVAGCTGAGAPPRPTDTPVASPAARPIAVAAPPAATPTHCRLLRLWRHLERRRLRRHLRRSYRGRHGERPGTLSLTRNDSADRWNKPAGDRETAYGLGKWTTSARAGATGALQLDSGHQR